jgi:hypothetical protein
LAEQNPNLFTSIELHFGNYTKKCAMTNLNDQTVSAITPNRQKSWLKTKVVLYALPLLGLGLLNILTLTNSDVHEKGYKFLEQIARHALPEHVVNKLLARSPSAMQKIAVAVATQPLRAANNDLISKNHMLLSEKERMVKSTQALVGKTQDLAAATTKLATSTKNLANETGTLVKERVALHGTVAALKNTAATQRVAVRQFSTRLAARSTLNATRNVVSIPGKALPVVGTGIIVAGVVWDLHDLCESLKDMNRLNADFGNEQEDLKKVCGVAVPTSANVLAQTRTNWRQAYHTAAKAVHGAGEPLPATAPTVPWNDVKKTVCSVVEPMPAGCTN